MKLKNTKRLERFSARLSLAAATGLVLLLCACNPAPKYAKPPANTPQAFKESAPDQFKEGQGWKVAQPGDDKIRGKWWEVYNDPTLNSLEEQVQISNQTVIQAEANYRAARALVVSARSALFPTVTASPSITNSRFGTRSAVATAGTGTATSVSGAAGSVVNTYSLPFDVTYTVDFWHRIRNQILENVYSAQASAADVATALLSTQATLAEDYYEIRGLDAQEGVLQDSIKNYRDSLNLTQTLFRAGIDSDEDVAQAQTQLDTTLAQATDIGVTRATYEHAIATLIGKPAA